MKRMVISIVIFSQLVFFSNSISSPSLDTMQGCVIGAAVGDALGRITEFQYTLKEQAGYMAKLRQDVPDVSPALLRGWFTSFMPYTDDTVMARILLEECLTSKSLGSEEQLFNNIAHRLIALFGPDYKKIDPLFDIRAHGPTGMRGARRLSSVVNKKVPGWWDITSTNVQEIKREGGCGSVMRAWPIGLVYFSDIEKVKRLADAQSRLTHRSPMARAACVACAVGVAHALRGDTLELVTQSMIDAAAEYDTQEMTYKVGADKLAVDYDFVKNQSEVRRLLAHDKLLTSDMLRYACAMAHAGVTPDVVLGINEPGGSSVRTQSLRGWAADEAIAAALYIFVRHSDNVQKAIFEGVNTPGDSDSIASLAGALVGAYAGTTTLHPALYKDLENIHVLKQFATATYYVLSLEAQCPVM